MSHFLVESYMPAGPLTEGREPPVAADSSAARLLESLYVPDDELCYCLYEAESAEQVERAGRSAGLPVDRVPAVRLLRGYGGACDGRGVLWGLIGEQRGER